MNTTGNGFSMKVLTEEQVLLQHARSRRRVMRNWLAGGTFVLGTGMFVFFVTRDIVQTLSFYALVLSLFSLCLGVIGLHEDLFFTDEPPWLDDVWSNALACLCEDHPSLADFRDQVRAVGRRFTREEYEAMQAFAREHMKAVGVERVREGCERLYGRAVVGKA